MKTLTVSLKNKLTRDEFLKGVVFRLVPSDRVKVKAENGGVNEQIPGTDISKEYVLRIPELSEKDSMAYAVLTQENLETAGVTIDELRSHALENLQADIEIRSMSGFLIEHGMIDEQESKFGANIQIVTNTKNVYGAASILAVTPSRNVIVIPSSVHEVLVMPMGEESPSPEVLAQMITEVNDEQLEEGDLLSYKPYAIIDGVFQEYK